MRCGTWRKSMTWALWKVMRSATPLMPALCRASCGKEGGCRERERGRERERERKRGREGEGERERGSMRAGRA